MSEQVQGGTSKLRLSAARSNSRLLKGYGPLAALLVAFVLMAMLVPTKAPQQEVVHESQAGAATTGDTGAAGSTTATTAPGSAASGGAAGTAGGSAAAGAAAAGGHAQTATAAPAAATGKSGSCPGQPEQVPGDPYSPPCIAFSGSNGGATSPGVTANSINVTYRNTADSESFQQTLASLGGADITDTTADIERTISALATYFDTHFQFYGRKLNIEYFNGQGSITNELLGSGQQQADADAVTAAQQLHAFAELDGVTEPYDVALAGQKVISIGAPYLSASFMGQYAPYMWSLDTESNDVVTATQDLYLKSMAGGKAAYAGGSLLNQPRKVAIIAPSDPWYQTAAAAAVQEAAAAGYPVADNIQYQLNLSTLSSQAATVISQLQNDGITTVICGCDPVFPVYLTSRAAEQGYTPEWVVAGVALTDNDIVGQLFDQQEWNHAFGVTFQGPTMPKQDTFGYAAYESVSPGTQPANAVDLIYAQMYEMAIGIQMAGPDLTPQTFENGMRAYPGSQAGASNAFYGTWDFPTGHYTPQTDWAFIYWDPTKVSPYDDKTGAYVVSSTRNKIGQYAGGPLPLPSTFPITPPSS
ncbi:MAG TPA: ABC transporter substrate-binding protein [Acidimicrobiales bacterium]|nr:ABC transporter substrate-binding protein [Acidimicrobiales bacterium]